MNTARKLALLVVAAGLAACSDSSTAPRQATEPTPDVQGSTQDLTSYSTISFSITIDPSRTTYFYLGAGNSLTFPAGSLCSLSSTYGEGDWDKPCNKQYSPVTVNVKAWLDAKGHAHVDFDKHLRFVPSSDPSKWVVITFADMEAAMNPFFNILYCPSATSQCKDESKKDPTLLTVRNPLTGKITRRIKHFSGYNVAAGEDESGLFSISPGDLLLNTVPDVESTYSDLQGADAEAFLRAVREARKSGYILASG